MATMVPPVPYRDTNSSGEIELFDKLKNAVNTDSWYVLHSLCIADHCKNVSGEADFVIIAPGMGVLCLEVKACRSLRLMNGLWYYGNDPVPDKRGPFRQASEAMFSIRDILIKEDRSLSSVPFVSACVFPYVEFDVASPEWHPWQVIDRARYQASPLQDIVEEVLASGRYQLEQRIGAGRLSGAPSEEQTSRIVNILRPRFEYFESPRARREGLANELKNYTQTQFRILDMMAANPRVLVHGPAGTGKTLLAMESARRMADEIAQAGRQGKTLFVCFNRNLAAWILKEMSGLTDRVHVTTLHRLMMDVCGINHIVPDSVSEDYWAGSLPRKAGKIVQSGTRPEWMFDALVMDEAQDLMVASYLDFLGKCLVGGLEQGPWRAFGDFENQALFALDREGFDRCRNWIGGLTVDLSLRENCRNTPRAAKYVELLGGMDPGYSGTLRPDDHVSPVIKTYDKDSEQTVLLENAVDVLLQEGIEKSEIMVLSGASDNKSVASRGGRKHRFVQMAQAGPNDIKFASIQSFKGLEAPAVVLTDIMFRSQAGRNAEERAREILYVGLSRATRRLVVLLRKDVARELLGKVTQ